jgi:Ca2+-binding RTX toxin-like protein
MRRRAVLLLLLAMAAALVAASGVAYALSVQCDGAGDQDPDPGQCKGTQASENIYGTSGDDVIYANSGDDKIIPYAGNDTVYAGDGNDEVRHSFGNDYIEGGDGADTLRGGFGVDTIFGDKKTTTTDENGQLIVSDSADNDHDLIDCAYLASRGGSEQDVGYGELTDTVVDCFNRDDQ